uniref:E3 ubiquitin-protein ligase E3D n=1 Tax=Parastrongyloides trichosuri TaxID=131310 RepID=A0A0N4ZZ88_PARTI
MPSLCEWSERSFMLEMKPKNELAALYVDCPPVSTKQEKNETNKNGTDCDKITEVVRVGDHYLELTEEEVCDDNDGVHRKDSGISSNCEPCSRYYAFIEDVSLDPKTLSGFTWMDQNRLFMCRIKAVTEGQYLRPKTNARIEKEILSFVDIKEFVEDFREEEKYMFCNECKTQIHVASPDVEIKIMPNDTYLENSSSSFDFYCRTSCDGHAFNTEKAYKEHEEKIMEFLPSKNKMVLSCSFVLLNKKDIDEKYFSPGETKQNVLCCSKCLVELGCNMTNYQDCYKFYHSAVTFTTASMISSKIVNRPTNFIEYKFETMERYFAYLLLSQSENDGTSKVVVRSLEGKPHMFIWIYEPYVVMTSGSLKKKDETTNNTDDESDHVKSFAALKVMYKIFDSDMAIYDSKAQGCDPSAGTLEMPQNACLKFMELLLINSHAFPPSFRLLGQFCVSFLKLNNIRQ